MNKANEFKDKLREICDKNQIKTLFKDKKTSVDILIDFKSGNYTGIRLSKDIDGENIEIDSKYSWIINKDRPSEWVELDPKVKNALDYYAISHFDYDDIDEDDFKDLNKNLEKNLVKEYQEKCKNALALVADEMQKIKDQDYERSLIKDFVNKFDQIRKKDSYTLKYKDNSVNIKINTKKESIKIKNNYSYDKKLKIKELVKGFDIGKIESFLNEKRKRKEYNNKMMEIEDSYERSSVHASVESLPDDKRDIDKDRNERENKKSKEK